MQINEVCMKAYKPDNAKFIEVVVNERAINKVQDFRLYEGLPVECIKTYDQYINRQFARVIGYNDTTVKLDAGEVTLDKFIDHWRIAYCCTIHSSQAITIDEPLTIHDAEKMDFRMLYTSISRATKWEYVTFNNKKEIITCRPEQEKKLYDYNKRITGYIYHLIDMDCNKVIYVGRTSDLERRLLEHKRGHFINRNITIECIREVQGCENINQLEQQEIAKFPKGQLENSLHNKKDKPTILKQSQKVEERKERGCVYINDNKKLVRVRYFVDSRPCEKEFAFGRKRTREEAIAEAEKFRHEVYQ